MVIEYYAEIYNSVKEIQSEEWQSLIDSPHDLAMDQRLIYLLENTLSHQARFWTVAIRDNQRRLIACACLSLFQTDIFQSATGFLKKIVLYLRTQWPDALKLKVLFCGLPLPSGHAHLRLRENVDPQPVLQLLTEVMTTLAEQVNAQLLVFKELDYNQLEQTGCLEHLGFVRGELEPIYQMSAPFKNFSEYQAALRSGYRRQVQLNFKKFNEFEMQVEHLSDPNQIQMRFSDHVHHLYLNVWSRAKEKLECFSADFFRQLGHVMPGQITLTIISHAQKEIAFAIGMLTEEDYHNLYIGLDYTYLEKADLYFNLFYHELDAVFRLNKKKIWLGQTSGTFKSRLGAEPHSRFFWVRPLNPLLRWIFKHFQRFIFPKAQPIKGNQVFKAL